MAGRVQLTYSADNQVVQKHQETAENDTSKNDSELAASEVLNSIIL